MENEFLDLGNQGKSTKLNYSIGCCLIILLTILFSIFSTFVFVFFTILVELVTNPNSYELFNEIDLNQTIQESISSLSILDFINANLPFLVAMLLTFGVVFFLMKRKPLTLISPRKIKFKRIFLSAFVWLVILLINELFLFLFYPSSYKFTDDITKLVLWIPFVLVFTIIQATTEEIGFRGYFLQFMQKFSRNYWFLIFTNAIVFTIAHSVNPEVISTNDIIELIFTLLLYFFIGLALTIITLRTQSLEAAIGLHAINNLYVILIVNYENSAVVSPALFTFVDNSAHPLLILITLIVSLICYYLIYSKLLKVVDKTAKI